ncbi:MAG: RluA family pseudouridine synthase [Bacteroidetes bacterium]|nr:RluA family pseudouridine synthase [Bacteroidota bacterium]
MKDEEELYGDQDLYEHHRFVADKGQMPMRLDKFVTMRIENATRTKVQKGIEMGTVLVNDRIIKSNYQIKPGDVVTVVLPNPPRNPELIAEDIPIDILYEDDDILLVNKAAGMVVHPGYNNYTGTLVNALLFHFKGLPEYSDEMRPGLVHRIDKDTSGLLLVAKTEEALVFLAKQFFDHSIERKYQALVWGDVVQEQGTIRGNLARDLKDRRLSAVFEDPEIGKHAVTHYRVLERFGFCTLIECQLETGRTHQIRAHMKHIGHPLFADDSYGGMKIVKQSKLPKYDQFIENCFKTMPRQALHAMTLGFVHPKSRKSIHFEVPLPDDFSQLLEKIRQYISNAMA